MNEQFRIAQKLGLMFRPEEILPKDIKSWAIKQLHAPSPSLGIGNVGSDVKPWPKIFQPSLDEKAVKLRIHWETIKKERKKEGGYTEAAQRANNRNNLMYEKDILRFSHRNVYGSDQLRLRLMSFWINHFTIGNFQSREFIGHAMEEAILANLNGSFSTMLYKVTSHPGMLTYLDNIISAGPNSNKVRWAKAGGEQAGLNDNLGRELLELHTVSPSANYTETDIRNAAKVLAGWGMDASGNDLNYLMEMGGTTNLWDMYKKDWAEPGNKVVLGKTIGTGKGGLKQLTDFLAAHEHTVMHLSTKLAEHFVSDVPNKADVNYIANAWRQSNGNLDQLHTAVIERAIASKEPKFQWPMAWLFQVLRLSNATYFSGWNEIYTSNNSMKLNMNAMQIFDELGQNLWAERQPNGYSSKKEEWMSGEMFERRIRFADSIWKSGGKIQSTSAIMDRIGASKETRQLVESLRGMSKRDTKNQFIALMCSPELMGLENA